MLTNIDELQYTLILMSFQINYGFSRNKLRFQQGECFAVLALLCEENIWIHSAVKL